MRFGLVIDMISFSMQAGWQLLVTPGTIASTSAPRTLLPTPPIRQKMVKAT